MTTTNKKSRENSRLRKNIVVLGLGNIPEETVIIGVEPKEIDWSMELTTDIKQKVPDIVDTVLEGL